MIFKGKKIDFLFLDYKHRKYSDKQKNLIEQRIKKDLPSVGYKFKKTFYVWLEHKKIFEKISATKLKYVEFPTKNIDCNKDGKFNSKAIAKVIKEYRQLKDLNIKHFLYSKEVRLNMNLPTLKTFLKKDLVVSNYKKSVDNVEVQFIKVFNKISGASIGSILLDDYTVTLEENFIDWFKFSKVYLKNIQPKLTYYQTKFGYGCNQEFYDGEFYTFDEVDEDLPDNHKSFVSRFDIDTKDCINSYEEDFEFLDSSVTDFTFMKEIYPFLNKI